MSHFRAPHLEDKRRALPGFGWRQWLTLIGGGFAFWVGLISLIWWAVA
jgi:hypothetical protein